MPKSSKWYISFIFSDYNSVIIFQYTIDNNKFTRPMFFGFLPKYYSNHKIKIKCV
jgi:hypothetical protein